MRCHRRTLIRTEAFINDPRHSRLEGRTLFVSSLFSWHSGDFNGGIAGFTLNCAGGELVTLLRENREGIDVGYLD